MRSVVALALAAVVLLLATGCGAERVNLQLPGSSKKCLRQEIHKDVMVKGEFKFSAGQSTVSIQVVDSKGSLLFRKENAEAGKFSFTTDDYDVVDICMESKVQAGVQAKAREVFLEVKHGVEAINYEEVAKAEKLKPMEMELRRLEDLSSDIVNDFGYMRAREEEMRDTNESTNSRVFYFSLFSITCLLSLTIWQIFYLRRYFKAKKLID